MKFSIVSGLEVTIVSIPEVGGRRHGGDAQHRRNVGGRAGMGGDGEWLRCHEGGGTRVMARGKKLLRH